jgi:hypothetical protein
VLLGTGVTGDWHFRQPNCGISRLVLADGRLTLPDGTRVLHGQTVT